MSFCTISNVFYADNSEIMQISHDTAVIAAYSIDKINCIYFEQKGRLGEAGRRPSARERTGSGAKFCTEIYGG